MAAMKKLISHLALLLAIGATALPLTSCAAVLAALPTAASILTDAFAVLSLIDTAATDWFRRHPGNEETQRAYLDAYTKAIHALNAANHALAGADRITQEEFDAAFAEFRQAYADLRAILEKNALMISDRMTVGATLVDIPTPEALTYRVQ